MGFKIHLYSSIMLRTLPLSYWFSQWMFYNSHYNTWWYNNKLLMTEQQKQQQQHQTTLCNRSSFKTLFHSLEAFDLVSQITKKRLTDCYTEADVREIKPRWLQAFVLWLGRRCQHDSYNYIAIVKCVTTTWSNKSFYYDSTCLWFILWRKMTAPNGHL